MSNSNPTGKPRNAAPVMREPHLRFIGAAFADGYSLPKIFDMLTAEYPQLTVAQSTLRHYRDNVRDYGDKVFDAVKALGENYTFEQYADAVRAIIPKVNRQSLVMFDEYVKNRTRINADPTYGVTYANKRQRLLKLSQNVDELDDKKVTAKGSYPVAKAPDGSMQFETFEIANKDHAEQRKTIQLIGDMAEGTVGGDINITIVDNAGIMEEDSGDTSQE